MDCRNVEEALGRCEIPVWQRADGVPAFRLNKTHRRYRKKFIRRLRAGRIRLERRYECLCGSAHLIKLSEKDRFGLPFMNFICADCGLVSLSPRMAPESLPEYYGSIYHPLICGMPAGTVLEDLVNKGQGRRIFDFVYPHLPKRELKVCDVGAASGSTLVEFRESASEKGLGCHLHACEYEEGYLRTALERGIKAVKGGPQSLSRPENGFDIIILSHVLEHFNDPLAELGILSGLLAEGGLVYVEVPGITNLESYGHDLQSYFVHAHNFSFNLSSLETVLSLSGFMLITGDESVRSIFIKGLGRAPEKGNCQRIMECLREASSKKGPERHSGLKGAVLKAYYRGEALLGLSGF
ncbi:MAG: class I SAM-dependent methyltransferase [Thermodesulfobacteriota bacterium]|nr:MAG: class I SAM-dependent methyltransferase [Thermodesulfobacteriota bacterium]